MHAFKTRSHTLAYTYKCAYRTRNSSARGDGGGPAYSSHSYCFVCNTRDAFYAKLKRGREHVEFTLQLYSLP